MYDDIYPTCEETHARLRIYPGDIEPETVTERLGIAPSDIQRRGEPLYWRGRHRRHKAEIHGWFLESELHITSRDSRRHVDWILDQVEPSADAIRSLQDAGCRMDIQCYWLSKSGHGGPTMSPGQMRRLADLNIELWFDIYGPYEDDDDLLDGTGKPPTADKY